MSNNTRSIKYNVERSQKMNIKKTETMNRTPIVSCKIKNFTVATLLNPTYFSLEESYYDKSRKMYCFVLSKQKLGIMMDKQIKDFENVFRYFIPHDYDARKLEGINTTLLFEMADTDGFDPAKEVNICIYDSDNKNILTRQIRWNKNHTYNAGTERFPDEAWESRKLLYTEWERIGKTLLVK